MHNSSHFSLPYLGMKDGIHTYYFDIGDDFFKEIDHSPVTRGRFTTKIVFDKQPGVSEMDLFIDGHVDVICDRCLSSIQLPVSGQFHLYVKLGNEDIDEDEVIYIKEGTSRLDMSQVLYEYICLSLPLSNTYDCDEEDPKPCDQEMLDKLHQRSEDIISDENDIWKNIKNQISDK